MAQTYRYMVPIRPAAMNRGGGDVPGLLDMLRYDAGVVVSWDNGARENLLVVFVTPRPATMDRWATFGLVPKEVS